MKFLTFLSKLFADFFAFILYRNLLSMTQVLFSLVLEFQLLEPPAELLQSELELSDLQVLVLNYYLSLIEHYLFETFLHPLLDKLRRRLVPDHRHQQLIAQHFLISLLQCLLQWLILLTVKTLDFLQLLLVYLLESLSHTRLLCAIITAWRQAILHIDSIRSDIGLNLILFNFAFFNCFIITSTIYTHSTHQPCNL